VPGCGGADAVAMALLRREPIRMKESPAFIGDYLAGRALFVGRLDAIGHSKMVARDSFKP
jgi:hypothetical protein